MAKQEYKAAALRRKYNAPKDGTALSGFVTEKENQPPRECGNCRWFDGTHCHHKLVIHDPEVPGKDGQPKKVGEDDCCDNFQNKVKK